MIAFFRQLRQRLLTENKFSKYLLYAVGEIFLVVIGILIAIQVDNRSEAIKNKAVIHRLLNEVQEEIQLNIQESEVVLQSDYQRDTIIHLILDGKLTKQSYLEDPSLGLTIITYHDLDTGNRAFQNLSARSHLIPAEYIGPFRSLGNLYHAPFIDLQKWNKKLEDYSLETGLNWSESKSFYRLVWNGKYSEEATKFFTQDSLYINQVTYYHELSRMRGISARYFNQLAVETYKEIHSILYPESDLPSWITEIKLLPIELE